MIRFRRAKENDFEKLCHLTDRIEIGITSIPRDKKLLRQRLTHTEQSFEKTVAVPHDETYLFVLEDCEKDIIAGMSGIDACTGYNTPFYSYRISKKSRVCPSLHIRNDYETLSLVNDNQYKTEIGSLYLHPEYRRHGNGTFLSRARFLFIAQFSYRFLNTIIAEMRGISDSAGRSPFWEHIGRHFFHMTFPEADRLSSTSNKQFIADLMPRTPLYIKLLAPSAQAVIGQPHPGTVPAMNILLKEGFQHNHDVDIFDAGPTLEVLRDKIHTVQQSRLLQINQIHDTVSGDYCLIANTQIDFCVVQQYVLIDEHHHTCILNQDTARLLQVTAGDYVRVVY